MNATTAYSILGTVTILLLFGSFMFTILSKESSAKVVGVHAEKYYQTSYGPVTKYTLEPEGIECFAIADGIICRDLVTREWIGGKGVME